MMQIEKGRDIFNHKKNDNQNGRTIITDKQSKYKIRRKILSKQNQRDKIFSFKKYIPVLQKKPDEGQQLIPQEKLDEIFLAAKQSLSEDESSSSGSYVMVKESSLIRLKRELFHERLVEGLMKEKINKFKEDLFKKLEQCQDNQQNLNNRQGLDSQQQVISQRTSKLEQNTNRNLQDKNSHNAHEVQARADGNLLIVRQIPAQVGIPEEAIAIQNDQRHAQEIQNHGVNVLEQQVQGLKNLIQDQRHAPEIQHHRVNELEQQLQGSKNLIQYQRHALEIQHHRVNVLDQYQNNSVQGLKKAIKKQRKPRQNYQQQYNQRQTQWDYESDSQSDQHDSQYKGNYQVVRTSNGQKYHKLDCEVAEEYGIAEQFPIYIARKRNYRPCQRCFPLS